MHRTTSFILAAGLLAGCASPAPAQTGPTHEYRVTTVVSGLAHPWGLAFLPDGAMLVTERPGRLRIIRNGQLAPEPVAGVPEVWARGQGGLLDVALHPDFERNRLVYLSYSRPGDQGATTAVVRGRLDGNTLRDVEDVIETKAWRTAGQHFGSRLVFDRDGYLFITVGDRGQMQAAQDRGTHQGKVLRLHDDGRVPPDNPFTGEAGMLPEIWSWGHRNPQSLALHPVTGEIWEAEHGARGGDEINIIVKGANYGWPITTYGINYNGQPISDIQQRDDIEDVVHYWNPSIATSGMAIYNGDRFPNWRGSVFVGGLAGQHLARIAFDGRRVVGTERLIEGRGRVRDVRTGPDGLLYVLIDAPDAPLLRIEPAD